MSHFYGTLQGYRGKATRCGAKSSGLITIGAGWNGAIETEIWYDEATGRDLYRVILIPWQGSGGTSRVLAEGVLNARDGGADA